ncbi:MAG: hypothetical protein AAGA58_04290 [Verrucomicrobiota bacterium]
MKDYTVYAYIFYLVISIGLTIWVARTLHKNGRVFLVDCFGGNKELADSVNHLLVVGFYLVNIGFVTLYLKLGDAVPTIATVFEALSGKVGVVLLVLGGMHFFNIYIFARFRRRARIGEMPPPVAPTATAADLITGKGATP